MRRPARGQPAESAWQAEKEGESAVETLIAGELLSSAVGGGREETRGGRKAGEAAAAAGGSAWTSQQPNHHRAREGGDLCASMTLVCGEAGFKEEEGSADTGAN